MKPLDKNQIKVFWMVIASFFLSSILITAIHGYQESFAYKVCGTAFDPYTPARNACEHAIKTIDRNFFLSLWGGMFLTTPIVLSFSERNRKD